MAGLIDPDKARRSGGFVARPLLAVASRNRTGGHTMSRSTSLIAAVAVVAMLAAACTSQAVDDVAIFEDLARSADLSASGHDLAGSGEGDLSVPPGGDLSMGSDMHKSGDLANSAPSCLPSGGCPSGPACGNGCCGAGESCDPNSHTCRCGGGPACAAQMMCAGPVVRMDGCGSVCCGNGTPCPK